MSEIGPPAVKARAWKRAADGIQLIVFGVFLLLTTQGRLPWTFWVEAVSLWPLLLVGAGLRIAFEKSRVPWVALASPLLIAAALVWLARGGRTEGPAEWVPQRAERPDGVESFRLSAQGALGRLELRAHPVAGGVLAEGRSASRDGGERVLVRRTDHVADVALRGGKHNWWLMSGSRREEWQLDLAPDLPIRFVVEGAGMGGRLDLAEGQFSGARIGGVFNTLELRLPAPQGDAMVTGEGVMNQIKLVVPTGTPVRVHTEGVMNTVDRPGSGDGPGYRLRVEGVFNGVEVSEQEITRQEAALASPR